MIEEFQTSDIRFVLSKDELGYKEVLMDFANAKKIRIVTYNISMSSKDDKLFELIGELGEDLDVELITNIPSRFETYYDSPRGKTMKNNASKNIATYISKLNPSNFSTELVTFFNFSNHAKIIGTENVVYIGSSNFSNESSNNYESGFLSKDKTFINYLYEVVFKILKEESVPYYKDDFNNLRLFIISLLSRLNNHYRLIKKKMFYDGDAFITEETAFDVNELLNLLSDVEELSYITNLVDDLETEEKDIKEKLDEMRELCESIQHGEIEDILQIDGNIYNYVAYSHEGAFWDFFENYSLEADTERLEHYVEIATDEANEMLENLCSEAEEDVYILRKLLGNTIELLKELLENLKSYAQFAINKDEIDNTLY
ncbi:phospholipase D-like domain-containing protein [Paenibacillus polymyxa]|uniref:phospholipase D-like domain-containing protein n=1 Tax=Paenibacillus polymyxa TaxID=1406 RepID=UPI000CDA3C20|nr:phospholipase D-like domain-containing protein [Paenibacillus polymyxa]POR29277.1 hypothetical protein CG775_06900 [Paenibacillus polymyxa]